MRQWDGDSLAPIGWVVSTPTHPPPPHPPPTLGHLPLALGNKGFYLPRAAGVPAPERAGELTWELGCRAMQEGAGASPQGDTAPLSPAQPGGPPSVGRRAAGCWLVPVTETCRLITAAPRTGTCQAAEEGT